MSHTPGPWYYDRKRARILAQRPEPGGEDLRHPPEPIVVANLYSAMSGDDTEADARLMAAAPALLKAAKGVDVLYAELHCALPEIVGTPGFDRVVAAVEQARAAIRAARGEG